MYSWSAVVLVTLFWTIILPEVMLNLRYRTEVAASVLLRRNRDCFRSLTYDDPVCTSQCVCFLLLPQMTRIEFF